MIEKIERLGREIETLWEKENCAKEAFPAIAFRTLQKSEIHRDFSMEKLLEWLKRTDQLPEQLSPENGFGQPPITVFRSKDFLIDLYFWVNAHTFIHSHSFRGAFTVLRGKKLQCHYEFLKREEIPGNILIGDMSLKEAFFLKEGDIQQIDYGPTFIHQVWHITCPAITLTIRNTQREGTQYTYLKPRLAYRQAPAYTPLQRKRFDTLVMLRRTQNPLAEDYLESLISGEGDYQSLIYLKDYFMETYDLSGVEKALEKNPRFQKWAPHLIKSLKVAHETVVFWPDVLDEGERLLLALLLSVEEREEIFRLIQEYYPGKNIESSILEWLKGLMKQGVIEFQLNETALEVLRLSLRGHSEQEICKTLSKIYRVKNSPSFRGEILDFSRQVHSHEFLKPLVSSKNAHFNLEKEFFTKETALSSGRKESS